MNNDRIRGNYPAFDVSVGVANSNTFRASTPAFGDATLIGFTNQSDATRYVIESTSVQRLVTAKFANSRLVVGVALCKSGVASSTTCGSITGGYPQTRVVNYFDMDTGVLRSKTVHNMVCTNITANNGDSGGPVYQRVGTSNMKGAGLLSARSSTEMCFDPVRNIENSTGTQLWIS